MRSLIVGLLLCLILACSSQEKKIKVAATSVPHGEMLAEIKEELKKEGYELEVIEVDDYQLPNRFLQEGEVDANFFQHLPFLASQKKIYGSSLVIAALVHYEPLGIYSKKIKSFSELREGAIVAIPCDPSNESRALFFLEDLNLIELARPLVPYPTPLNIKENIKNLRFEEVDAPLLTRVLSDVDIAIIPANFVLQAKLSPSDALALENKGCEYANVLVIRKGEEKRAGLQALAKALTSEKMKRFIELKYKGALQPLF